MIDLLCQIISKKNATHLSQFMFMPAFISNPQTKGFPDGSAGRKSACDAGDLVSIPGLGRLL